MQLKYFLVQLLTIATYLEYTIQQPLGNRTTNATECRWPGGESKVPQVWYKEEIPNPRLDTCKCGRRGKSSWVCDPNEILSLRDADEIDRRIEILRNTTGNCHCSSKKCAKDTFRGKDYKGYQAAVVILKALKINKRNPSSKDKKKVADDYADYLRDDKWEFGLCDDDLVILISDDDRVVFTKTGDAISTTVTDKCVKDVTAKHKSKLSDKNYGAALQGMISDYNLALNKKHSCNKPATVGGIVGGIIAVIVVIGAFCGIGFCCRKCNSGNKSSGDHSAQYSPAKTDHPRSRHGSNASQKSASSGGGGDTF